MCSAMGMVSVSNLYGCGMNKQDAITKLTMLKLKYGNDVIPLVGDMPINQEGVEEMGIVVELSQKNYLDYIYEPVVDDEGITHKYQRGFKLSHKAKQLLEEASNE